MYPTMLKGKRAVIFGAASNRSIAFGIAKSLHQQGASIILSYQSEKLVSRVSKLAEEVNAIAIYPCDVSQDDEIKQFFNQVKQHWDTFDILVHAIAYAPADQISGNYLENISRQGFNTAHEISSYSLSALCQAARQLFSKKASVITLTYIASSRVVPNYNTMGLAKASLEASVRYLACSLGADNIRVNAISSGPIKTLAAAGIKGMRTLLTKVQETTPIQQETTIEQVGNVATFLASDLSDGVTGEIIHVDQGFHTLAFTDTIG